MHNWNHNLLFFSEHERWKAWLCHKHGQLIEMMVMEEVDKEVGGRGSGRGGGQGSGRGGGGG